MKPGHARLSQTAVGLSGGSEPGTSTTDRGREPLRGNPRGSSPMSYCDRSRRFQDDMHPKNLTSQATELTRGPPEPGLTLLLPPTLTLADHGLRSTNCRFAKPTGPVGIVGQGVQVMSPPTHHETSHGSAPEPIRAIGVVGISEEPLRGG